MRIKWRKLGGIKRLCGWKNEGALWSEWRSERTVGKLKATRIYTSLFVVFFIEVLKLTRDELVTCHLQGQPRVGSKRNPFQNMIHTIFLDSLGKSANAERYTFDWGTDSFWEIETLFDDGSLIPKFDSLICQWQINWPVYNMLHT